jgi:hypothetical protein
MVAGTKRMLVLIFIAILLMCTSCATIFSRNAYTVPIRSEPSGATYRISDRKGRVVKEGTTPDQVLLKAGGGYFRRAIYRVDLNMKDREHAGALLTARVDGWYWVNFLFFPMVGMLSIDPISGSMYTLRKQMVYEVLPLEQ